MGKIDEYAAFLRSLDQVEPYLLEESGLPGPRSGASSRSSTGSQRPSPQPTSEQATTSALSQALGYCWSVAVAASPEQGEPVMERWLRSDDRDVRWIMRENLRKRRLSRADPAWVARWRSELGRS